MKAAQIVLVEDNPADVLLVELAAVHQAGLAPVDPNKSPDAAPLADADGDDEP